MGKGYKGVPCAYCFEAEAGTADHVIAREFFPKDKRDNLPKVAACQKCNNEKSKLEHLLTAVLPFGARHPEASEVIAMTESRLEQNMKLHRWLAQGIRSVLRSINGRPWQPEMTVPLNGQDLERLAEFIVKGLARYHWGLSLSPNHFVRASFLNEEGRKQFDPFFTGSAQAKVACGLGGGVFSYEGVQSSEHAELSLWKMSFYEIEVSGDPRVPGQRASIIYGVSVPKDMRVAQMLAQILRSPQR